MLPGAGGAIHANHELDKWTAIEFGRWGFQYGDCGARCGARCCARSARKTSRIATMDPSLFAAVAAAALADAAMVDRLHSTNATPAPKTATRQALATIATEAVWHGVSLNKN